MRKVPRGCDKVVLVTHRTPQIGKMFATCTRRTEYRSHLWFMTFFAVGRGQTDESSKSRGGEGSSTDGMFFVGG